MKSSSYWYMACGLPELHHLGLFTNQNQLQYMISRWGFSLPSAPLSVDVSALANFIPVCTYKRSGDIFICLFILSCFVIRFL